MIILCVMETMHGMVGYSHNNETRLIFCDKKSCFGYSIKFGLCVIISKALYDFPLYELFVDLPSS